MNLIPRLAAACALAAASAALAAPDASTPCANEPTAAGLPQRLERMRDQMERIEWTTNREEQRALMDLHMKTMHEGMREVHRRQTSNECRMDMMQALMEQMMRHQLAEQEADGH